MKQEAAPVHIAIATRCALEGPLVRMMSSNMTFDMRRAGKALATHWTLVAVKAISVQA